MFSVIEAASDFEITTTEVKSAMSGVFSSAIYGIVMMFAAKMFIKAVNPPKEEAREIIKIAEMF